MLAVCPEAVVVIFFVLFIISANNLLQEGDHRTFCWFAKIAFWQPLLQLNHPVLWSRNLKFDQRLWGRRNEPREA